MTSLCAVVGGKIDFFGD